MRIIKFRYWNKKDGWCGAFSVHQTGLVRFGDTEPIWQTPEEEGGVLMQFTDCLDSEGKEIYEGDILQFSEQDTSSSPRHFVTQEVKFTSGGFHPRPLPSENAKIIGNVYENPELIENLGNLTKSPQTLTS